MSFHTAALRPSALSNTVDPADPPLVQSAAFAAALTRLGRPPLRLSPGGGRGEVTLVRRALGPLRLGLVSRCDLTRPEARRLARAAEVSALILNPETAAGAQGLKLQTEASVAVWDLSPPEDALRAGMKQKWRNRLAKAERARLRVSESRLDAERSHWLFERERVQAARRGYANWPEPVIRAYAAANGGQARLFDARSGGTIVAAMLFLLHGGTATYQIGWTGGEGRALCAHHLLLWVAARRLRARGTSRLDLGTIATDRAPGLARFKLGVGARPRTLGGTWLALPSLLG